MERKRKADDDWEGQNSAKKPRQSNEGIFHDLLLFLMGELNLNSPIEKEKFIISLIVTEKFKSDPDLFQLLPQEILHVILLEFADPSSLVLLTLTSKHWNSLVSQILLNKKWHDVYLASRRRFKVNIDGTVLDQVFKSPQTQGYPDQVFEWDFEIYDDAATRDCVQHQQDLLAEDEYLARYPVKYWFDQSDYMISTGPIDAKHKKYDPNINYKRLALKIEAKYRQFELWRGTKPVVEAFTNEECSCLKEENELVLYDEKDEQISELESKLDIDIDWDQYLMRGILNTKHFEDDWDNRSDASDESDIDTLDVSHDDVLAVDTKANKSNARSEANQAQEDVEMKSESSVNDSDDEDEHEYDGLISIDCRDSILEDMSSSSQHTLKVFIHVLSAVLLGHCPAPSCHDSALISTAKHERSVVRTGDILQEVISQLKYATTLDNSSSMISVMICALQKLRMSDLLLMKQGIEQKYPYLSAVYSVLEVEENISEVFYIADKEGWAFNFPQTVNPWTSYFQSDIATDEDFDLMPDWLSIRHSIHRLMRKGGVICATPNASEFAVHKLSEFIHQTLAAVVSHKSKESVNDDTNVNSVDILRALDAMEANKRTTLYTDKSDLYNESPIVLHSDSSDYSSESSVDSDWVDGPITDLDEDSTVHSVEEDEADDGPLHSIIQESLKKCVQHAQYDAKEDPENFEVPVTFDSSEDVSDTDDIIGRQLSEINDERWEEQPNHDDKTAYYVPKTLFEDAVHYSGRELQEDDALVQLFKDKYEDDIPFHDMPDDQRQKLIELRKQTNQMIKEQCDEELEQQLTLKFNRMKDNVLKYESSIRSDANECKTMIVDLINHKTLKHTIHTASQIIRSSSVLTSIKLMNLFCTDNKNESTSLIAQLMNDIASSPSITSIVLFKCHFTSYSLLTNLVQNKPLTKFHIVCPVVDKENPIEGYDELSLALKQQESLTDLVLPNHEAPTPQPIAHNLFY